MITGFWPSFRASLLTMGLCGLAYPLLMTGLAQCLFPWQATGSLLTDRAGHPLGVAALGQVFSRPEYFHPRPSANGYDATNSGGSNWGATNRKLINRIQTEAVLYRKANGLAADAPVPVDAVTASASGLDPDISLNNALQQASRVAAARHLKPKKLRAWLQKQAAPSTVLGLSGDSGLMVNVLRLNLALNKQVESIQ